MGPGFESLTAYKEVADEAASCFFDVVVCFKTAFIVYKCNCLNFCYMRTVILMLQLLWLLVACAPATKEAYLSDYKSFMERVADERKDYGDVKWKAVMTEYKHYSQDWYNKFEDELTVKERMLLAGYEAKFAYYIAAHKTSDAFDDMIKSLRSSDKKSLRSTIEDYIEKDMVDDVEELYKEAKKIGGETLETVEEIFDELDIKY